MSNEIKVGDKVRVREDAPKMYLRGFDHIFTGVESVVSEVEDDNAVIIFNTGYINSQITIPTKYLVKADAEAKEAKFKKGDKVRYIGDIQEHKGEMFVIDGDILFNDYYKQWQASSIKTTPTEVWGICNVPLSDLEPDTKPTEQTEAEKKPNVGSIKIPVEVPHGQLLERIRRQPRQRGGVESRKQVQRSRTSRRVCRQGCQSGCGGA